MEHYSEAHYFHIPSQGNIYSIVEIKLSNGNTIILFSSAKRDIYYFEYIESLEGALVPSTKEVAFTYIPSGAEIISLDAFNKSTVNNELVIGITIIKNSNDSDRLETFLNIYTQLEEHKDFDIENIAQNCLTIQLNFIPYQLMHTYLVTWQDDVVFNKEFVFILSGSDNQIHIYHENQLEHVYEEMKDENVFPEFEKTPSPVIWIDICYINNYEERVTAFGCECGYLKLMKVNTKTKKIVYNFFTQMQNYISNVKLFFDKNYNHEKCECELRSKNNTDKSFEPEAVLNLIVISSIYPAMLFCNVLNNGLGNHVPLTRHNDCTVYTCCLVADIDLDRSKEILIGTSSEEILLFKLYDDNNWHLEDIKYMYGPILALKHLDIIRDGVRELIVFTMKGLHILQQNSEYVRGKLNERIKEITATKEKLRKKEEGATST